MNALPKHNVIQVVACHVIITDMAFEVFFNRTPREWRYIYFIAEGGAVKIGMARAPFERLVSLQIGNSRELKPLAILMVESRRAETSLHRMFKEYSIRGEWYRNEGRVAEYIAAVQKEGLETWEADKFDHHYIYERVPSRRRESAWHGGI